MNFYLKVKPTMKGFSMRPWDKRSFKSTYKTYWYNMDKIRTQCGPLQRLASLLWDTFAGHVGRLRLFGCLFDWVTDCLSDWLIDILTDWSTGWSINWLISWWTDWLIDWLTGWLNHWSTGSNVTSLSSPDGIYWNKIAIKWLIDWLVYWASGSSLRSSKAPNVYLVRIA